MRTTFSERHRERQALERDCVSQVREGRPQEGSGSGAAVLSEASSHAQPQRTPTMATVLEHQSQSVMGTGMGGRRTAVWTAVGIAAFVAFVSIFAWQMGSKENASSAPNTEPAPDKVAAGQPDKLPTKPDLPSSRPRR